MEPRSSISNHRALTLVECLAAISVVALLIALTMPAFRRSRLTAESMECMSRLSGIGTAFAITATDRRGHWPNMFHDDLHAPTARFTSGTVAWETTYWNQVQSWLGALIGPVWEGDGPATLWTCPAVARTGWRLGGGPDQLGSQPADGALISYYYSASLISDWRLWDPDDPAARLNFDKYRAIVGVHQVRHASQKVALAENADFHGNRVLSADDPATEALNALFCDGHVERVRLSRATPPIPTARVFDLDEGLEWVPFLGTPFGYLGSDLSGPR